MPAKTIDQVFDLLQQFNYDVRIEGHTDNSPIHTEQFPSNWELSASRAADVARLLVENGFPPEKLSVVGFAEFHPKVPNTSAKTGRRTGALKLFISAVVSEVKWSTCYVAVSIFLRPN